MWFVGFLGIILVVYLLIELGKKKQTVQAPPAQNKTQPKVDFSIGIAGVRAASSRLTWVGTGEEFVVSRYHIKDPLAYISDGAPITPEASCIDVKLKVGVQVAEPRGRWLLATIFKDISRPKGELFHVAGNGQKGTAS